MSETCSTCRFRGGLHHALCGEALKKLDEAPARPRIDLGSSEWLAAVERALLADNPLPPPVPPPRDERRLDELEKRVAWLEERVRRLIGQGIP